MKFLVSFFALALYFVFALADTAEEITYPDSEITAVLTPSVLAAETNLPVAQTITPHPEKAGLSF
jgi:hypothetical protein